MEPNNIIPPKKFSLGPAVMAALAGMPGMSGINLPGKAPSAPTPKKPWQTKPGYLKNYTVCKNPKQANHVNMMFNKNYGEKFGYAKTDFGVEKIQ